MNNSLFLPLLTTFAVAAASCTSTRMAETPTEAGGAVGWDSKREVSVTDSTVVVAMPARTLTGIVGRGRTAAHMPKARIYKTNGDYADRVPVTLNASRDALVSFPAPGDLRNAEPVRLDDGYLLDRRGINANTAFTRWTYAEYMAMKSAPTPAEIMANIIPDARVTEIYEMPFAAGEPDAAARCNALITSSLPNCTPLPL